MPWYSCLPPECVARCETARDGYAWIAAELAKGEAAVDDTRLRYLVQCAQALRSAKIFPTPGDRRALLTAVLQWVLCKRIWRKYYLLGRCLVVADWLLESQTPRGKSWIKDFSVGVDGFMELADSLYLRQPGDHTNIPHELTCMLCAMLLRLSNYWEAPEGLTRRCMDKYMALLPGRHQRIAWVLLRAFIPIRYMSQAEFDELHDLSRRHKAIAVTHASLHTPLLKMHLIGKDNPPPGAPRATITPEAIYEYITELQLFLQVNSPQRRLVARLIVYAGAMEYKRSVAAGTITEEHGGTPGLENMLRRFKEVLKPLSREVLALAWQMRWDDKDGTETRWDQGDGDEDGDQDTDDEDDAAAADAVPELADFGKRFARIALPSLTTLMLTSIGKQSTSTNDICETLLKLDITLLQEILAVARIAGSKSTRSSMNFPYLLRTLTPFVMDAGTDADKAWLLESIKQYIDPSMQYGLGPAGHCVGYVGASGAMRAVHYDPAVLRDVSSPKAHRGGDDDEASPVTSPGAGAGAENVSGGPAYDPIRWGLHVFERYARLCETVAFSLEEHMPSVGLLLDALPPECTASCCERVSRLMDSTVCGSGDVSEAILDNTAALAEACAHANREWGLKAALALYDTLEADLAAEVEGASRKESAVRWAAGLLSSLIAPLRMELSAARGVSLFGDLIAMARRFLGRAEEWQRDLGVSLYTVASQSLIWPVLQFWRSYLPADARRRTLATPVVPQRDVAPEWTTYTPEYVAEAQALLLTILKDCYNEIKTKQEAGTMTDADCQVYECFSSCFTELLPHPQEGDGHFLKNFSGSAVGGIATKTDITRQDLVDLAAKLLESAGRSDIANEAVVHAAGELVDSACLATMSARESQVISRLARMTQIRSGRRRVSPALHACRSTMSYFNLMFNVLGVRRLDASEKSLMVSLVPLATMGLKQTLSAVTATLGDYVTLSDCDTSGVVGKACSLIVREHAEGKGGDGERDTPVSTRTLKGLLQVLTSDQRMSRPVWDNAEVAAMGAYVIIHAATDAEKDVQVMFEQFSRTTTAMRSEYGQYLPPDFHAGLFEPFLTPRHTQKVVERLSIIIFGVLMGVEHRRTLGSIPVINFFLHAFAHPQKGVRVKAAYALHNLLFLRGSDWTPEELSALDAACSSAWLLEVFEIDYETENLARPDGNKEQKPFADTWRARVWKLLFKLLGQRLFDRVLALELKLDESTCVPIFEMVGALLKVNKHIELAGSEAFVTGLLEAVQESNLSRMSLELREALNYGASGVVRNFDPATAEDDATKHYITRFLYAWWRRARYTHMQKRVLGLFQRYVLGMRRSPAHQAALVDAVNVILDTEGLADYESVRVPLATFLSTCMSKAYWTPTHEVITARIMEYADQEKRGKHLYLNISSGACPAFKPLVPRCLEAATSLITERKHYENEGSDTETLVYHAIRWVGIWFQESLVTLLQAAVKVEKSRLYQKKGAQYLNYIFAAAARCQSALEEPAVYDLVHMLLWDHLRCNIDAASQDATGYTEKTYGALTDRMRGVMVDDFFAKLDSEDVKVRKGAARGLSGVLAHKPLSPTPHTWAILKKLLPVALHDSSHEVKKRAADAVVGWRQSIVESPLVWRYWKPEVEARGLLHDLMHLRSSRYSNAFS